mmetsp:Transcript_33706/g.34334  ORF Transcript_33706/g.34334 Transcript_33706/m.34334 type:complete len:190 (+) Transcript_33706:20-589(+)
MYLKLERSNIMHESLKENEMDDSFEQQNRFSFEEFERLQAQSTVSAIFEIEEKLYTEDEYDSQISDVKVDNESGHDFGRYNYGYSAHNDSVNKAELTLWKNSFNYLRIESIPINTNSIQGSSPDYEEEIFEQHGPLICSIDDSNHTGEKKESTALSTSSTHGFLWVNDDNDVGEEKNNNYDRGMEVQFL